MVLEQTLVQILLRETLTKNLNLEETQWIILHFQKRKCYGVRSNMITPLMTNHLPCRQKDTRFMLTYRTHFLKIKIH